VGVSKEVLQNEALKMLRGEQDKEGAGQAGRSGPPRAGAAAGARGGKEAGKEAGALDEFCVDLTAQVCASISHHLPMTRTVPAVAAHADQQHRSLPVAYLSEACVGETRQRNIHHC
jgi:hypothetical protein